MAITYLLLGSNQGNREYFLKEGYRQIAASIGPIAQASSVYETAAWGLEDQPAFLNQALLVKTNLLPDNLLAAIHQIENTLGRIRETRWGMRAIDIDILLYNDLVLHTGSLTIPHVQLPNRRFALTPLAEIAPGLAHPLLKENIAVLLAKCPDQLPVNLYKTT